MKKHTKFCQTYNCRTGIVRVILYKLPFPFLGGIILPTHSKQKDVRKGSPLPGGGFPNTNVETQKAEAHMHVEDYDGEGPITCT